MKTIYQSYPAYSYSFNGVTFFVWKAGTGKWYIEVPYLNDRDGSQEFPTKKSAIKMAEYHLNKK